MKIGVLSDAHGNLQGFNACLDKLKDADHLIFAGDLFGYYFDSLSILKQLRNSKVTCILGNHDVYFLSYLGFHQDTKVPNLNDYLNKYGPAFNLMKDEISFEELNWLNSLRTECSLNIGERKILIVHGSPWNSINEYIYPDYQDMDKFSNIESDVIIMGHTHYPLIKKLNNTILFNPGSCGQPRDKDLRASCGMIEILENNISCEIYRVSYSYDSVIEQCKTYAPSCELLTKFFKDTNE